MIFSKIVQQSKKYKNAKIPGQVLLHESGQEQIVDWFQTTPNENPHEYLPLELPGNEEDLPKFCAALPKEPFVILDITWPGAETIKKLSLEMKFPYIRADVSISPALILLDKYLDYRNSTDVALIFDNPDNVDQALYFWIDTTRLRMVISENLDKTTADRLRKIRPSPNNFAIVATTHNMNELFKNARFENLVTLPERWNLVFLDFKYQQFDISLLEGQPINLLKLDTEICCGLLELDLGCTCPESFNFLEQFVLVLNRFLASLLDQMDDANIELGTSMSCNGTKNKDDTLEKFKKLVEKILEDDHSILEDELILKLKLKGTIEIGQKNGDQDVVANFLDDTVMVRDGKAVSAIKPFYRIGITHAVPWSYTEIDPKTGNKFWTGYCADFATKLAELMHFDFEFVEPKIGTFGKKVNGVWNGIIGDLARGETDFAISALIMTADREEVVDFVAPYFEQTGISIVMRKPVRKTSLFKFMTVLKLEVWLSIVGALVVTGFMVWFLDKYSPYSARNNKKAYPYPCRTFTLKESFWFALTSFTPQGGGEAPKALSGRTLVASYWLFVVLMLATFTANLAAFLTVERMQAPVQSLEQLARQSRINYTVVKNSDTHKYFINMKHAEETLYRMWKELTLNASTDDSQYRVWDYPIREQYGHILLAINDSNPVKNAAEGFRLVDEHLDADYALIHDSSEIKYEISRNCNFTEVGEVFAEKPYAVAVQQGSHLQDDISKMMLVLQKDRYFEYLQSIYWNHSSKGNCPSTDDNEGITLESLGGVFIATLFGLALAMITLAGEAFYYRRKMKMRNEIKNITQIKPYADKFLGNVPGKIISPPNYPITIGSSFKPVQKEIDEDLKNLKISHISLYPKGRNRFNN